MDVLVIAAAAAEPEDLLRGFVARRHAVQDIQLEVCKLLEYSRVDTKTTESISGI